jgi:hypothetical protein
MKGSLAAKLQSAWDSTADSAAQRQVVASLGQSARRYGSLVLVADKESQPDGVDNLANQSYAEPPD